MPCPDCRHCSHNPRRDYSRRPRRANRAQALARNVCALPLACPAATESGRASFRPPPALTDAAPCPQSSFGPRRDGSLPDRPRRACCTRRRLPDRAPRTGETPREHRRLAPAPRIPTRVRCESTRCLARAPSLVCTGRWRPAASASGPDAPPDSGSTRSAPSSIRAST